MIEIRNFGDKRTIVLYTDENKVYQKYRDLKKVIKVIPYTQTQTIKKEQKEVMVGADIYFPKTSKNWLIKAVGKVSETAISYA